MLINLLVGDITIIGPRPMEIDAVDLNGSEWQEYFRIKPGLFNYAVLVIGKTWETNFFGKSIHAWIISKGNVKARGEPDESIMRNYP